MRNALAAAGVAAVGLAAAGCAGQQATVSTNPASGAGATGAASATPSASAAAAASSPAAGPGDTITVKGFKGEKLAVTLVSVNTAVHGSGMSTPPAGKHFVDVKLRIRDEGTGAYSASPSVATQLVDASGQSYEPSMAGAGCHQFPGAVHIARGASSLGCVLFTVPTAAKITQVQFTPDAGMGQHTAQWSAGG